MFVLGREGIMKNMRRLVGIRLEVITNVEYLHKNKRKLMAPKDALGN